MKRIRKGKDISATWPILTDGEPLELSGRDLSLRLRLPNQQEITMPFAVAENNILFNYYGRDHKYLGVYGLTLYENYGKIGQTVVDLCDVFELVPLTCCEGGDDDETLTTKSLLLESGNISFGSHGIDSITKQDIDTIFSLTSN